MKVGVVTAKTGITKTEFEICNEKLKLGQFVRVKLGGSWQLAQVIDLKYKARTGKQRDEPPYYLGSLTAVSPISRPFPPNAEVHTATKSLIENALGIRQLPGMIHIGHLIGSRIPVNLNPKAFVKHIAVMGKTGEGKTYTATVIIEELIKAGITTILVDTHNDFLPIADVPEFVGKVHVIDPEKVGYELKHVYNANHCTIIPMKDIKSRDDKEYYVGNLALELLYSAMEGKMKPTIKFIDECQLFAPETFKNNSKAKIIRLIMEGRKFGLGVVPLTQRPAKLSKDVLSQCSLQILHKTLNGNDLRTYAGNIEGFRTEDKPRIQRLATGECLIMGANLKVPIYAKIKRKLSKDRVLDMAFSIGEENEVAEQIA